jgi:hypothetical protein
MESVPRTPEFHDLATKPVVEPRNVPLSLKLIHVEKVRFSLL